LRKQQEKQNSKLEHITDAPYADDRELLYENSVFAEYVLESLLLKGNFLA
jgi:hypothetical protein